MRGRETVTMGGEEWEGTVLRLNEEAVPDDPMADLYVEDPEDGEMVLHFAKPPVVAWWRRLLGWLAPRAYAFGQWCELKASEEGAEDGSTSRRDRTRKE